MVNPDQALTFPATCKQISPVLLIDIDESHNLNVTSECFTKSVKDMVPAIHVCYHRNVPSSIFLMETLIYVICTKQRNVNVLLPRTSHWRLSTHTDSDYSTTIAGNMVVFSQPPAAWTDKHKLSLL